MNIFNNVFFKPMILRIYSLFLKDILYIFIYLISIYNNFNSLFDDVLLI